MRALLFVGLLTAPAVGYESIRLSTAKPVANGKFVFVQRVPATTDHDKDVWSKYRDSGLYPADDPTKPLWTCTWTTHWDGIAVSADGKFAVRAPDVDIGERRWALGKGQGQPGWQKPLPAGWQDRPAVYVSEGKWPHRTLVVKDVFDVSRFTYRDQYMGPVVEIDSLDDQTGLVTVSTSHEDGTRQTAVIEFRTGKVVSGDVVEAQQRREAMTVVLWVALGGLAAVFGLAVWLVRRKRRRGPVAG